jgi:heme-degrading monooxygenase HmoA
VLVVTRYTVPEQQAEEFLARAREALDVLAKRPGYRAGRIGRAADEPTLWVLTTEWENVGSYRRALSAFEVKVTAVPLLSLAHDEPSAFELMYVHPPG